MKFTVFPVKILESKFVLQFFFVLYKGQTHLILSSQFFNLDICTCSHVFKYFKDPEKVTVKF